MTRIGTLAPFSPHVGFVADRLTNGDAIAQARIRPMDLYLALKAYQSGQSQPNAAKPASTWAPVPAIVDALEEAYELSSVRSSRPASGSWWRSNRQGRLNWPGSTRSVRRLALRTRSPTRWP
jgi:hypothetical protein